MINYDIPVLRKQESSFAAVLAGKYSANEFLEEI